MAAEQAARLPAEVGGSSRGCRRGWRLAGQVAGVGAGKAPTQESRLRLRPATARRSGAHHLAGRQADRTGRGSKRTPLARRNGGSQQHRRRFAPCSNGSCRTANNLQQHAIPFLSRPSEDSEGCPALAGVRNLGLDDPSPDRPVLHCNFGGALSALSVDTGFSCVADSDLSGQVRRLHQMNRRHRQDSRSVVDACSAR